MDDGSVRSNKWITWHTGNHKEAIVAPSAKSDMQRQGNKYGNLLHNLLRQGEIPWHLIPIKN